MEIIITPDRVKNHKVAKYAFKNFDAQRMDRDNVLPPASASVSMLHSSTPAQSAQPSEGAATASAAALSQEERETLSAIRSRQAEESGMVQNLVKKVEEFGDNVIKLQMRLEKQEDEFEKRLEEEKKRAFEEGKKAGENEAQNRLQGEVQSLKGQLESSLKRVDEALERFEKHAASLEKELSSVAVEIAGEVIKREVGENGTKIAQSLAKALLEEIKEAMKITLRTHPDHAAELSESLGSDGRVQVVADKAVAPGGVVITSDAGNIDAQIHNRFLAVKKSILEGGHE